MFKYISTAFLIILNYQFSIINCSAQPAKIQAAANYLKYGQLDKAKATIDEVMASDQTKDNVKAWYYRGAIYMSLFNDTRFGNLCDRCMNTAYESFKKAREISPKSEWADSAETRQILMRFFLFNDGAEQFNNKAYQKALEDFELVLQIAPDDTGAVMNAAFSADNGGFKEKAKQYYQKLVDLKSASNLMYARLANLYLIDEKDTAKALNLIREGRKLYPDSMNLVIDEINLLLPMGRSKEASEVIETAIKMDSTNQTLYLALGNMYDEMANNGPDGTKGMNYSEYRSKAEQAYLKGLQYPSPNADAPFKLNINLGAIYFNQAAEYYKMSGSVPLDQKAKHDELISKAKELYVKAQPYLEKAHELRPADPDITKYLRELYLKTDQTEKAKSLQ